VTTTTSSWFFAAARIMEGPPMSMFSTASAREAAPPLTVLLKG